MISDAGLVGYAIGYICGALVGGLGFTAGVYLVARWLEYRR